VAASLRTLAREFACVALAAQIAAPVMSSTSSADSVPHGCPLVIHVDGFRNRKGVIGCAVFQSTNGWPEEDDKAYTRAAIPITGDVAILSFAAIPPGRYGIACLQDENANHHLERNIFRVPKEGFGFSNNPRVTFSAPSWKEASVEETCPATRVDIHLIYK
jgi:uncharacterized protein (DUF2141 family)